MRMKEKLRAALCALVTAGTLAACSARGEYDGSGEEDTPFQAERELSFELFNPGNPGESVKGALEGTEFTVVIDNSWGKTALTGKFTMPQGAIVEPDPSAGPLDYSLGQTFTVTKEGETPVDYTVVVEFKYLTIKRISDFVIEDNGTRRGQIDEDAGTIHVILPYSTQPVGSYTPIVTLEDGTAGYTPQGEQYFGGSPVIYQAIDEANDAKSYTVTATRAANNANMITAFSVATSDAALAAVLAQLPSPVITHGTSGTAGNPGTTGSIVLTVPQGMAANFTPSLTHEGASISPAEGVAQNFSSGKLYTVTAANGDLRAYNVTLTYASGIAANLSSVTSNSTTPGTATTSLTLTFSTGVPTLKAENISLSAGTGSITKGALTLVAGSDYKVWHLAVSGVSKNNLVAAVAKAGNPVGFELGGFSQNVTVQSSTYQFETLTANGTSDAATTTELTLVFDAQVSGLSASNITLTAGGGSITRGNLTPVSGGTYKLAVSGISANNLAVTVALSKSGNAFNPASKTVNVFKAFSGTYALTFKGNGGVFAGGVEEKIESVPWEGPLGAAATVTAEKIPAVSRAGWELVRWDSAADGSGAAFSAGMTINTATTLWAIWNPDEAPVEIADPTQPWLGGSQEILIQRTGRYRIELWGAQGGYADYSTSAMDGGKGGYTKGEINLTAGTMLYVYTGGTRVRNLANSQAGGFNGGGSGSSTHPGGSGGGATDIRTVAAPAGADPSSNAASIASRIMVAAGGGGANVRGSVSTTVSHTGGNAGGLSGSNGIGDGAGYGGSQTLGGSNTAGNGGASGSFGKGGSYSSNATGESVGGGGGGWFGGASGSHTNGNSSGAGGSSYISGYSGCIGTSSTTSFLPPSSSDSVEKSKSWTGLYFIAGTMSLIDGGNSMPKPDGTGDETGHEGPGFARVTFIE